MHRSPTSSPPSTATTSRGSGWRRATGRWNTYVAVDDADAAAERATSLGATVVAAPADAGPGGRGATLLDPQGCEIRLWQARRRLGAQVANAPGAWNFSNLHTADLAAAQRFYGDLFGWRFTDQGWATAISVPGYGDHLEATIDPDIRTRQAGAPEGFEDVIGAIVPAGDAAAGLVGRAHRRRPRRHGRRGSRSLGGTVLHATENDWTREAVVRDPQGAVFTASQFTPPDSWELSPLPWRFARARREVTASATTGRRVLPPTTVPTGWTRP